LLACAFLYLGPSLLRAQCTVSAVGVSYGSYNPLDASNLTSTGTISINCNDSQRADVLIGPSLNSGVFVPRQMRQTSGSVLLNYNVYTTSALSSVWGDGTQGTSTQYYNVKKNKTENALVYGSIPAGQDVPIGSYSEALVVTINF
jgi:spore coat protein U-like protein